MATNTLIETVRLQSTHDVGKALDTGAGGKTLALAGNKKYGPVVYNIGTSEETITIATIFVDAGSNAHYLIKNLDPTNYVQMAFLTTVYHQRIGPGMSQRGQLDTGATFFLKANSSACDVEITLINA